MATFKSPVWKRAMPGLTKSEELMKADKDYFLDEKEKLTTDESKAAFLLIRKGQDVTPDIRDKYGIGKEASAPAAKTAKETKKGGEK